MKIRTAKQNHLCTKCNEIISNGEKYYDWYNTNKEGTYYHRRFHIGCIEKKESGSNNKSAIKPTIVERVQKLLDKNNGCIMAVDYGKHIKCYVCGIHYDEEGNKTILCETWGERKPYYEDVEYFRTNYVDVDGYYF